MTDRNLRNFSSRSKKNPSNWGVKEMTFYPFCTSTPNWSPKTWILKGCSSFNKVLFAKAECAGVRIFAVRTIISDIYFWSLDARERERWEERVRGRGYINGRCRCVKRSRTNEQVSRENRWNEPEQRLTDQEISFIRSIDWRFVRLVNSGDR